MEVSQENKAITVTQTIDINQLLDIYQMSNCNLTSTLMVEELYLTPAYDDFIPYLKNVSVYKQFSKVV